MLLCWIALRLDKYLDVSNLSKSMQVFMRKKIFVSLSVFYMRYFCSDPNCVGAIEHTNFQSK